MTVSEYLKQIDAADWMKRMKDKDGRTLAETVPDMMHIWSNEAAAGYALYAMDAAGLAPDIITAVLKEFSTAFDSMTVEAAEAYYKDFEGSEASRQ